MILTLTSAFSFGRILCVFAVSTVDECFLRRIDVGGLLANRKPTKLDFEHLGFLATIVSVDMSLISNRFLGRPTFLFFDDELGECAGDNGGGDLLGELVSHSCREQNGQYTLRNVANSILFLYTFLIVLNISIQDMLTT